MSLLRSPAAICLPLAILSVLFGCRSGGSGESSRFSGNSEEIRIKGSDTMVLLNRRLAARFMKTHPGVAISVEGGGSATGLEALKASRVDIAAVSRPVEGGEVQQIYARKGRLGVRFLLAQDPLSVYLNPGNPVENLKLDQLRGIFSGAIRSWSSVGGAERPIRVLIRPPTSGSYRFFQQHVLLGGRYSKDAETMLRTIQIVERVRDDPLAIGYGGLAWARDVRCSRIEGVPPTAESVRSGAYPLTRYLSFYTSKPPEGRARSFIDWCLSPEGQLVVRQVGYVPLWIPDMEAG